MKKYLILGCCFSAVCTNAVGATLLDTCSDVDCTNYLVVAPIGCGDYYTAHCKKSSDGSIMKYADCYACINSAYELTTTTASCGGAIISYGTCKSTCEECTDCISDTTWETAVTSGGILKLSHQQKITRTCDCGTCVETTQYRCAAGYYGSPTSVSSGCTRCPSSGGVYGICAVGSTAITSCYIPSKTSMTEVNEDGEEVGTYQFTTDCYYSN